MGGPPTPAASHSQRWLSTISTVSVKVAGQRWPRLPVNDGQRLMLKAALGYLQGHQDPMGWLMAEKYEKTLFPLGVMSPRDSPQDERLQRQRDS